MTANQIWIKFNRLSEKLNEAVTSRDMEALRQAAFRASYLADYLMKIYRYRDTLPTGKCVPQKVDATTNTETEVATQSLFEESARPSTLVVTQERPSPSNDSAAHINSSIDIQDTIPTREDIQRVEEDIVRLQEELDKLGVVPLSEMRIPQTKASARRMKAKGFPIKIHWVAEDLALSYLIEKHHLKDYYDAYMSDMLQVSALNRVFNALRFTKDSLAQVWVKSIEDKELEQQLHRTCGLVPAYGQPLISRISAYVKSVATSLQEDVPLQDHYKYVLTYLEANVRYEVKMMYGTRLKSLV